MTIDKYKAVEGMLYNYKSMKAEIKNIDLEIEELKNEYRGCGAISYKEKVSPTYKFNSSVEDEVTAKEKQIKYLSNIRDNKQRQIEKIDNALEILTDSEKELIDFRYFNRMQFKQIEQKLNINKDYCCEIRKKIINNLIPIIFIKEIFKK